MDLDDLGVALDEATLAAQLPNPGLESADARRLEERNRFDSAAYIIVLRKRLIKLGYMGDSRRNRESPGVDAVFLKAVRGFQVEAGLQCDAWAGPKTWKLLQQLVSFEDEQVVGQWSVALTAPAVLRAAHLRLYTLGFMDWRRDRLKTNTRIAADNPALTEAIAAFHGAARELGLTDASAFRFDAAMLSLLFAQDELVAAIDANPDFMRDPRHGGFLVAIARVELWLLGYEVSVGSPFRRGIPTFRNALLAFWSDNRDSPLYPARRHVRENVSSYYFCQLVIFAAEDETADGRDDRLLKRVEELSIDEQLTLQERVRHLASSIWDGMKRLYRWLRRMLGRALGAVSNLIKNLARLIARNARRAFLYVAKAVDVIHRSLVYRADTLFNPDEVFSVAIGRDLDLDFRLFLNQYLPRSKRDRILSSHENEARIFDAACRILGHLLGILRFVLEATRSGVMLWFVVLTSLARLVSRFGLIVDELDAVMRLEIEEGASIYKVPVT
jgi:hypothetical protein